MKNKMSENGIEYVLAGDYYIPDLKLPDEERTIGKPRAIPLQMFHCRLMRDGIVLPKRITGV